MNRVGHFKSGGLRPVESLLDASTKGYVLVCCIFLPQEIYLKLKPLKLQHLKDHVASWGAL